VPYRVLRLNYDEDNEGSGSSHLDSQYFGVREVLQNVNCHHKSLQKCQAQFDYAEKKSVDASAKIQ